jgi:hypothetical protein
MSDEIHVSDAVDREFLEKLATRGYVHLLSNQISVRAHSISFDGIDFPDNCVLEYVSVDNHGSRPEINITFGFAELPKF